MDSVETHRRALLVHDGELADVYALLNDVGASVCEPQGAPTPENMETSWDLVIGTAKRILDLADTQVLRARVWIAVLDNDSRTLRTVMQRAGIDLIVRRPVHPMALRLLILHSLYRGPEKRQADRVCVGFPVHYRMGLRRHPATMVELSESGCRLVVEHPLSIHTRIALRIPRDLTDASAITLKSEVIRARTMNAGNESRFDLFVAFRDLSPKLRAPLRTAVQRHSDGPAVLPGPIRERWVKIPPPITEEEKPPVTAAAETQEPPETETPVEVTSSVPPATPADTDLPMPFASAPVVRDASVEARAREPLEEVAGEAREQRRGGPRWALRRHLVAMADEATRILLGRDISMGGMRIDANPLLDLGDEIKISIHLRAQERPLMVQARVDRDDGDQGLLLRFHDLTDDAVEQLHRLVDILPVLAEDRRDEESVFVSQILEHTAP